MYLNGKVLLMEEHPEKERYIAMMDIMGKLTGQTEETPPNYATSVFKKFGTNDMTPIDRRDLFKYDVVLISVEENNFMVHKPGKNSFVEGDIIYLLNNEITEIINEY